MSETMQVGSQTFVPIGEVDTLRKENAALRAALQDLYDASPASPDSDSLCQAQLAAEKVLGIPNEVNRVQQL